MMIIDNIATKGIATAVIVALFGENLTGHASERTMPLDNDVASQIAKIMVAISDIRPPFEWYFFVNFLIIKYSRILK